MHIDNPTGYDTKLLKKLCTYVERNYLHPSRAWKKQRTLRIRYHKGKACETQRQQATVTWNASSIYTTGFTISMPEGYCRTVEVARFLYGWVTGAWPPSGGEFHAEILARFPVALFDNPSRLKTRPLGKRRPK